VVALMRGRAAQQGTSLSTAVAPGTPPAWVGDPQRLRQVVTNLVANAIRSTPGGIVRIEVRRLLGREFLLAAWALGASPVHVARRHLVPHLAAPLLAAAGIVFGGAVVAEAALAHTNPNEVEAAYQRGSMVEKRRRLMDAWGAYCANGSGAKVVQFPARLAGL
jgi:hypothetical protein